MAKQFMSKEEIPDLSELTDEIMESAIDKDWTTYGAEGAKKVEQKCAKSKSKKKMTAKQLQNLVQFRETDERSEESKKASLEQLRLPTSKIQSDEDDGSDVEFPEEILEPDKLREILVKEEQRLFIRRWQEYMAEHQRDFNRAEDYDTIVELLLNQVHEYRIYKRMKNVPSLVNDKSTNEALHGIHNRIINLRRDLKTTRKGRIESKETKQSEFLRTVTELAKTNQTQGLLDRVQQRLLEQSSEEDDLIKRKRERQNAHY